MEQEHKEDQIADAAQAYLVNRWQFWGAIFLAMLPNLAAAGLAAVLINAAFTLTISVGPDFGTRDTRGLWVLCGGIVLLLAVYAVYWDRIHRALLGPLLHPPVVIRPPHARPIRHRWLWMVNAITPGAGGLLFVRYLWEEVPPQRELLAATLWFTGCLAIMVVVDWITERAQPRIMHLLPLLISAAITGYALAVCLGLPAPRWLLAPDAMGLRGLGPILLTFVLWFLVSGIYGQLQLRRLQRLVNQPPESES